MIISKYQFTKRFTDTELGTILAASEQNVAIKAYLFKLQMAEQVDTTWPELVEGLQAIVDGGLLAQSRLTEILTLFKVRILAPFNEAYPDVYAVEDKMPDGTVIIAGGMAFAPDYWETAEEV